MDYESKFGYLAGLNNQDFNKYDIANICERNFPNIGNIVNFELLRGGFSNTNYKITAENGKRYVLRLCREQGSKVQAEYDILLSLNTKIPIPPPLGFIDFDSKIEKTIILMEYVEGVPLYAVEDSMTNKELLILSQELGSILAKIHSIHFNKSGFLGENLKVVDEWESFPAATMEYFIECLDDPIFAKRLTCIEITKLRKFIKKHFKLLAQTDFKNSLVHADFNSKNIIVKRSEKYAWTVSAIIDWEFAFSGSPFIDLGNFFRFKSEIPPYCERTFVEAYNQSSNTPLPSNWYEIASYLDLMAMFSFLRRDNENPRTFSTANQVISNIVFY